jgi:hypothetical protein
MFDRPGKSLKGRAGENDVRACVLIALLLQISAAPVTAGKLEARASSAAPARNVPASQPAGQGKGGELAALEQKLLGSWQGADREGNYTFNPDGTFQLQRFTPGNNTLTGTWSLRWDALPPTLVVTCKTSDFKKNDPTGPEWEYLGKPLELKLLELNSDVLVYRFPNEKLEMRCERPGKN